MIIPFIIIIILALWSLWGYFSSRVEHTDYNVIQKMADYEIREYPAHIVAQTTAKGTYREALNLGFRIVAGYIFGGNTKKQTIATTALVTAQRDISEKISMTAPVLATTEGDSHIISFGMPRSYTLETLPEPLDPQVEIVPIPLKRFAALKFSWSRADARVKRMEIKLLSALARDKVEVAGSPVYAGYNAPWTPPWMVRNEIMVEIVK
jgi:hypothetical protein